MPVFRPIPVLIAGAMLVAATNERASAQGADRAVAGLAPTVVPAGTPPATVVCTPGHCVHRGHLARLRCKRHLQDAFIGYPDEFVRPPLGARLHAVNRAQVSNGEAALMVLREYDFEPGTTILNARGRDRLSVIAANLPRTFYPLIIERTLEEPGLDARRRNAVLATLAGGRFAVPPQRVLIGPSPGWGLPGDDAELLNLGRLERTSAGGPMLMNAVSGSPTGGGGSGFR